MKYFRTYPWGMQLLLFLLMSFTFMSSIGAIVLGMFPKLTGFAIADLAGITAQSPAKLIHTSLVVQGIQNLFIFLLPAATFAYLAHPEPAAYLGLRKPGKPLQMLLVVLVMAGAMPVLILIENLIGQIDFGAKVKAAQAVNDNIMRAYLQMPTIADFLRTFVVMAIIPAVGEELFFRGTLMRFARKRSRTMIFPILFTAAVFSYSHTNIYGYLPIFLAGSLLALIYQLTGSLWCSIVAHMFFNGAQIVLHYIGGDGIDKITEQGGVYYGIVAAGAVVFAGAFYMLLKHSTPLPQDWAEDYTLAERNYLKEKSGPKSF